MIIFALPTTNLDRAHRTTALATTVSIESAVDNFYTEYGRMPNGEGRVLTGSGQGVDFLKILLGLEGESAAKRNVRDIKFLSVREGKNRKNGLSYGMSGIPEGMFDPYGNAYTVFLTGEGEGGLRFQFAGRSIELEGRRAAAVSPGKDGKLGTSHDIKSW